MAPGVQLTRIPQHVRTLLRGCQKCGFHLLLVPRLRPLCRRGDRGARWFEFITFSPLGERVARNRRFLQPGRAG